MHSSKLDQIDWKILAKLQENARISNLELADEVHLSPSPCLVRVKALEQSGIIRRYVALVDPSTVGLGITIFIQVRLEKQLESAFKSFEAAVMNRAEIMECSLMTGASDYLLRAVLPNLTACHQFVTAFVAKIPGVANIKADIALKHVKYKTALPIEHGRSSK